MEREIWEVLKALEEKKLSVTDAYDKVIAITKIKYESRNN